MSAAGLTSRDYPLVAWLIFLGAGALALLSARPYAGSWNDGSRLASVEAIVDHHTLAIDDSIFVRVPPQRNPYAPGDASLLEFGTRDKMFIRGHFYSDKPAVISLLMAGCYWIGEQFGLPTAAERPELFCWIMTLITSGVAYVVGVSCVYGFGRRAGLPLGMRVALTISFAVGTVALTYTRHVNNHIMLLGVIALLLHELLQSLDQVRAGVTPWGRLAVSGTLAGLGYCLDLGAGPILFVCLAPVIVYRTRRVAALAVFLLAALPWLATHHALNYAVGGTFKPMNAVPEYFLWPGCPFTPENLTGFQRHGPITVVTYSLALLFGHHGFFGHNLCLFLLLPALSQWRFKTACWKQNDASAFKSAIRNLQSAIVNFPLPAELTSLAAWCTGTWLLYSVFSNNFGGACCSVRWFVPFLAPAYYGLALLLQAFPNRKDDFCILGGWSIVLGMIMLANGPWSFHLVPLFWPIQALALTSWLAYRLRRNSATRATLHYQLAARDSLSARKANPAATWAGERR